MRAPVFLALLLLGSCALPGRETFAPAPVPPAPADIAATQAFAGRIALVSIVPGTADVSAPLRGAVDQALAIKPAAQFQVVAQCQAGAPDEAAACLSRMAPQARAVARGITADGVPADRVSILARSGGTKDQLLVYVK